MVKADASRNYYADLKVAPTASENEVRKAFRSLALQYHPDRNPGHEADFVVKFQEIQAAHEVLCDPTLRLKYDNERKKYRHLNIPTNTPNTPRARPPPPPRNAHTTTTPSGSYYRAPPPKPQPQPQPQRPPPPQHYQTYNAGQDRFTNKNFRPPPTAQRPHAAAQKDAQDRANVFTAWQKMKTGAQPEQPRPNPTNPNNPNGTPFGRSQSTRVPSTKSGFNPGTPGADEGPAKSGGYRSSYARPTATPPMPAESSSPNVDAPFSEGNRVRTPYYTKAAGIREEGIGRSASMRNSPSQSHQPSPSADSGTYSDSGRRQQRNSYGGNSSRPQFPQMYPDSSDESEAEIFRTSTRNKPRPPPKASRPPPPIWAQNAFETPPHKQTTPPPSNGTNNFKSRSEESINMKFSPSDWHGKFQGSADYFAPNVPANKGRQSPTRGKAMPQRTTPPNPASDNTFKTQFGYMPPPPPGPPPQSKFAPAAEAMPHTAKFSPEIWSETFKEPSWAMPNEVPDRKNADALKRPKPVRKQSIPRPQDQPDRSRPKYQATAEEPTGEPDEMDIDSDTPPTRNANTSATRPKTAPSSPRKEKSRRTGSVPPKTAPSPAPVGTSSTPGLNGLSGIAAVEPFLSTQNDGLSAFDALKNTLPFESQASSAHPTKANTPRTLKLPPLPAAPHAPLKLDQATTDAYFSHMEGYVKAFHTFSKGITNHFASRSTELEDLDDRFIHIRGETTKKLGFASYLNRMKEDEAVMTTWKIAQERHIKALEQCEEVRNKTIKLYQ
ncbi:hypothetical protein C7974DRAFT_169975 [Boeremia exigua]|uniref:uncharacterized protein n=1 Tax=Boeremia exigua TaxID=749465 RepID=UPI001E8CCE23|nr:uncharacterized protein C7974DRAFT_169975 [Boeremia exigua]KAH6633356.1 hypothetical protein C7974DRAFT_169975 [Boeremia exigua]